jgi:hypothetical protein
VNHDEFGVQSTVFRWQNYGVMAASPPLNEINGAWSVESWIFRRHEIGVKSYWGRGMDIDPQEPMMALGSRDGALFVRAGEWSSDFGATLPLRVWSHVVVTFDGITLRAFVDGDAVATVLRSGTVPPVAEQTPFYIGTAPAVSQSYADASMDIVRIYAGALSGFEVRRLATMTP